MGMLLRTHWALGGKNISSEGSIMGLSVDQELHIIISSWELIIIGNQIGFFRIMWVRTSWEFV